MNARTTGRGRPTDGIEAVDTRSERPAAGAASESARRRPRSLARGSTGCCSRRSRRSSASGCGRSPGSRATTSRATRTTTSCGRGSTPRSGRVGLVGRVFVDPDVYRRCWRVGLRRPRRAAAARARRRRRSRAARAAGSTSASFRFQPSEFGKLLIVLFLAGVPRRPRRSAWASPGRSLDGDRARAACRSCSSSCSPTSGRRSCTRAALGAVLFAAGTRWTHLAVLGVARRARGRARACGCSPPRGPRAQGLPARSASPGSCTRRATRAGRPTTWRSRSPRSAPAGYNGRGVDGATQTNLDYLPEHAPTSRSRRSPSSAGSSAARSCCCLYLLVVWRGLKVDGGRARRVLARSSRAGSSVALLFQIFVNVGMTIGIAPITGIPLPFVSVGGSSMIANLLAIGVLQAIRARGMRRRRVSCGSQLAGCARSRCSGSCASCGWRRRTTGRWSWAARRAGRAPPRELDPGRDTGVGPRAAGDPAGAALSSTCSPAIRRAARSATSAPRPGAGPDRRRRARACAAGRPARARDRRRAWSARRGDAGRPGRPRDRARGSARARRRSPRGCRRCGRRSARSSSRSFARKNAIVGGGGLHPRRGHAGADAEPAAPRRCGSRVAHGLRRPRSARRARSRPRRRASACARSRAQLLDAVPVARLGVSGRVAYGGTRAVGEAATAERARATLRGPAAPRKLRGTRAS